MVKVAITGALVGYSRKEAAAMIESAGAEFELRVTHETDYLVAIQLETAKARKAHSIGVRIITQGEFEDFVAAGAFPKRTDTNKPKGSMFNLPPELDWQPLPGAHQCPTDIEYCDADGVITKRRIRPLALAEYTTVRGFRSVYIKATDHSDDDAAKTFRADRVLGHAPFLTA